MKESLSDYIKKEINEITIPEEKLDHTIEKAISKGRKRKYSLGKKIIYGSSAAVLLFGLFVGSAFVSPVMAEVVSKIPYLGQLVASKSIGVAITDELEERGYPIAGVGVSFQGKKEISIRIDGSQSYFETVKGEVEEVAKSVLQTREYNDYSVAVSRNQRAEQNVSKEDQIRMEKDQFLISNIRQELEKHHYEILQLGIRAGKSEKTINLEIPNSVSDEEIQDMKKLISDVIVSNDVGAYSIKIKEIDMVKRDQEVRWAEILTTVGEDLMGKKEYKVTGLAYSVHPEPELIFKTSIRSDDSNAKEMVENLELVIEEFLKSEELISLVKNDSYTITIRSQDGKKIN